MEQAKLQKEKYHISFTLNKEEMDQLREFCKREQCTQSYFIRKCIYLTLKAIRDNKSTEQIW